MIERPAPVLTDQSTPFWTGGADDQLLVARCQACGRWLHPPKPVCPSCRARDIRPEPVSGRGTVWSWTMNRYPWIPGLEPPYVIAEVELDEQPGLRLLTTVVDCDAVRIGMPVTVRFERAGDAYVPVFAP